MKFISLTFLDILYVYIITIKETLGMSYHSTPPPPCLGTSSLRCLSCLGEYGLSTLGALSLHIYQISGQDFLKGEDLSQPKV
jgi:hypothetical protein